MPNTQLNQIYNNFLKQLTALKQKQNKIIDDFNELPRSKLTGYQVEKCQLLRI